LQILAEAQDYARELKERWNIQGFTVRVGINTGLVIIGGDTEAENTIMGTAVNLAARLESAAKPGTLLISDYTYQHVRGVFDLQLLEPVSAKGFTDPVQVYRVLRETPRAIRMTTPSVAGIETRMVGRDAELLMLLNSFHDAMEDAEVRVVTVVGDAGVGKKRLLYEFETWLDLYPDHVRYFVGRATPETEGVPNGLVRRIFAHHFEILESDSASRVREKFRAGMADTISSDQVEMVGQLLGFDFTDSPAVQAKLSSESFGELATAYLVSYMQALASMPTVILFEDIQWADHSSLDLLDYVVTELTGTRLLVICLARPSLFERRPNWGEGVDIHTQINLKPLSRRASRALVGEILRKVEDIPIELRNLLVEEAEGSPFYIEELIKMLIEDGVIVQEGEKWRVELERLADARVPPTLAGILHARLDSLPGEEKAILQKASVVGRLFWEAVVAELASDEIKATQVNTLLEELRTRELIFRREHSDFELTNEYIFRNNILRDITYETVLLKQRRAYHSQVAQWLERSSGERVSEYLSLIARHYELAGETEKSVSFLQQMGEDLHKISAFRDAARAFERALALLPPTDQGESAAVSDDSLAIRAMLLVKLGNITNRLGDYRGATQLIEEGLALARQINDPQAEIEALNRLAQIESERGEYETARGYLDEVLALAHQQDDLTIVASTLSMLSTIAWRWGDLEQAEKCSHESLGIYRELDNQHKISQLLNILGILATLQENYEQAEQYYEQGLKIARERDERQLVADLLSNLGYTHHHGTGNLEKAKQCFQESLLIAIEIDHRAGVTSTKINLGKLHIMLGEHKAAWNYLLEALPESVAIGAVPLTLDALVGVVQLQIEVGQFIWAAEILGLAMSHPALEVDSKQQAELALDSLRKAVDGEQLGAAMEMGKAVELDAVITELEAVSGETLSRPTR